MLAKTGLKLLQVIVMAIKYKMALLSGKFTAINSVKLRGCFGESGKKVHLVETE